MTMTLSARAPADNEDLIRAYRPYVLRRVRQAGVAGQDADDVTNDIIVRLIKADVVGQYDPDYRAVHDGRQVPVKFSSFLTSKIDLHIRGKVDDLRRRRSRETLLCDAPADGKGTRWLEVCSNASRSDTYPSVEESAYVDGMRRWLLVTPNLSDRHRSKVLDLWDYLVAKVRVEDGYTYADIQRRFGVGSTTVTSLLRMLRAEHEEYSLAGGREPMVSVGGVACTAVELRAAADVLAAAPGNHVLAPLQRERHKLARAEAGWYHRFADAEFLAYPEIEPAKGSHSGGHRGRVKCGVLHGLRRLADELELPPPRLDSEETRVSFETVNVLDEIEAELWHIPGMTPQWVDRVLAKVALLGREAR